MNTITAKEFGKSYALLEAKVSSNDEDLFNVLSKLPDYDAYIKFRTEFKEGALAAGYRETGFDMFWSRIMARLVADFGYTVPRKPVTTEGSKAAAAAKEKSKAAVNALIEKPEAELIENINKLAQASAESAAKGQPNAAAAAEISRMMKALATKRKQAAKGLETEKKVLLETLREWLKTAPMEVLKAMEVAGRAKMQELHDAKKQADEIPPVDMPAVKRNAKKKAA